MKIRVRCYVNNNIKYEEKDIEIQLNSKIGDIINLIKDSFKITKNSDSLILILNRFNVNKEEELNPNNKLDDYKINDNDILTIKISGESLPLILNRNAITIAYLGPIVVFVYLSFKFGLTNFDAVHAVILFISNFHYIRRVLETQIDVRATDTIDVLKAFSLSFYYWFLYGYLVGVNIFSPDFNSSFGLDKIVYAILFLISEFNNYMCHNILRDLKVVNKGKRGIPTGNMFKYVSCANYFWEILSWVFFWLIANTMTSALFILWSIISMTYLAVSKHNNYVSNFDNYPKNRTAIIPFIL
jgi:very-long-chain enoyl-CoA reductase